MVTVGYEATTIARGADEVMTLYINVNGSEGPWSVQGGTLTCPGRYLASRVCTSCPLLLTQRVNW